MANYATLHVHVVVVGYTVLEFYKRMKQGKRQLILDTETTGFEPSEGHRLIEFAALEMIDRKLTGNNLHVYINPERDIPVEATNVHGITLDMVQDKPVFAEYVDQIIEFISDADLIIHNAKFDIKFLDFQFEQSGRKDTLAYVDEVIDSLAIARRKFPGAKNNLDALCDRFRVDRSNRGYHGALIDCELLYHVYLGLTKEQISLLGDEKANKKITYAKLDTAKYHLKSAVVSEHELQEHLHYLKALDKASNGNCLWFNKSKEFINEK